MPTTHEILGQITRAESIADPAVRIDEYRRLAAAHPEFTTIWFNLASDLVQAGRPEEARLALDRALQIDPILRDSLPQSLKPLLEPLAPTRLPPPSPAPAPKKADMPTVYADMPARRAGEDMTGRMVGKWRLGDKLGGGAFGTVYEAENVDIKGRRAAVKVLRPELAVRLELQQRFINEMSIASRTEHENIVQIFDGGITDEGVCYSAMELLRGTTLTQAIRTGALGPLRTIDLGTQIAGALAVAHGLGVVHRDLKPDNVFLERRPSNPEFAKLLDFGIAKLRDNPDGNLTTMGTALGTPGYMAPEQWMMLPDIDGRADIYALGVIFFECLSGRLPFNGQTTFEFQQAHLRAPIPTIDEATAGSKKLSDLVTSMLAKARDDRPRDMNAVAARLKEIREEVAARHAPAPASPGQPKRGRSIAGWLVAGAALVALLGGAGFIAYRNGDGGLVDEPANPSVEGAKAEPRVDEHRAMEEQKPFDLAQPVATEVPQAQPDMASAGPTAPAEHGGAVQLDVSALLTHDIVLSRTSQDTLGERETGVDAQGHVLVTRGAAQAIGTDPAHALPADGVFAMGDRHPSIRLAFHDAETGNNARLVFRGGSFVIPVPARRCERLHLYGFSADGDSELDAVLSYADGSSDTREIRIADWAAHPESPPDHQHYLAEDLVRYSLLDRNVDSRTRVSLLGVDLAPQPSKTLVSIKVKLRSGGIFAFMGATAW